jgi:putative nucleotidyltransferase with HDIG domain
MSDKKQGAIMIEPDVNLCNKVSPFEPLESSLIHLAAKKMSPFSSALDSEFPPLVLFQEDNRVKSENPGKFVFAEHSCSLVKMLRETNEIADLNRQKKELERERDELRNQIALQEQQLHKTLNGTIQAMTMTVEARDPYTAGHQRRVADLGRAIADEMGLPEDQSDAIRMACLVHDLGKLSIPLEILSKPRYLTSSEFGMIQTHLTAGFAILQHLEFPWPIAKIVLQHHERLDGSGYPDGLSGEDILLEAKVLAVADVVEAMANKRPYRQALGIDAALGEITAGKGKSFDTEVVNACLRLFVDKQYQFN